MNINIEKISNGFILALGDKRIFCDVPEAVCGELAQWALAECENVKECTRDKMTAALELMWRQQEMKAQRQMAKQCTPTWETTLKSI